MGGMIKASSHQGLRSRRYARSRKKVCSLASRCPRAQLVMYPGWRATTLSALTCTGRVVAVATLMNVDIAELVSLFVSGRDTGTAARARTQCVE